MGIGNLVGLVCHQLWVDDKGWVWIWPELTLIGSSLHAVVHLIMPNFDSVSSEWKDATFCMLTKHASAS